jgi:glycine betaine/choline ABC-type transport system substrate-binding protein
MDSVENRLCFVPGYSAGDLFAGADSWEQDSDNNNLYFGKIMKKKSLFLVVCFVFCLLSAQPLHCCVGRILVVAVSGSPEQAIMGEMLSILINERTGTTVNIVEYDPDACHEAVLKEEADIYINYTGVAQAGLGGANDVDDPLEVYALVNQSYKEKFGMVWLKPFGFRGPLTVEGGDEEDGRTLAAPVSTREVLKKFPVLDRVINKLGGRIDDNAMSELMKKTENQDIKETVREFLKKENLI